MSVDGVAAEVVAVMARARSLFENADAPGLADTGTATAAAASSAIAGHTDELSGSFAAAHREALEGTVAETASRVRCRCPTRRTHLPRLGHRRRRGPRRTGAPRCLRRTRRRAASVVRAARRRTGRAQGVAGARRCDAAVDLPPHRSSTAGGRRHPHARVRAVARRPRWQRQPCGVVAEHLLMSGAHGRRPCGGPERHRQRLGR